VAFDSLLLKHDAAKSIAKECFLFLDKDL